LPAIGTGRHTPTFFGGFQRLDTPSHIPHSFFSSQHGFPTLFDPSSLFFFDFYQLLHNQPSIHTRFPTQHHDSLIKVFFTRPQCTCRLTFPCSTQPPNECPLTQAKGPNQQHNRVSHPASVRVGDSFPTSFPTLSRGGMTRPLPTAHRRHSAAGCRPHTHPLSPTPSALLRTTRSSKNLFPDIFSSTPLPKNSTPPLAPCAQAPGGGYSQIFFPRDTSQSIPLARPYTGQKCPPGKMALV